VKILIPKISENFYSKELKRERRKYGGERGERALPTPMQS
jgi:hypothetical protein